MVCIRTSVQGKRQQRARLHLLHVLYHETKQQGRKEKGSHARVLPSQAAIRSESQSEQGE